MQRDRLIKTALLIAVLTALLLCASCGTAHVDIAAPEGLVSHAEREGIKAEWKACEGANCYYVYRRADDEAGYYFWGVTEYTEIFDITVDNAKSYSYKVFPAVKSKGSYVRGELSSVCAYVGAMKTPSINEALLTSFGCTLKWSATGADKYRIYRAESEDGEYTAIGETDKLFFVDKEAGKNETQYCYKLSAITTGEGDSFESNISGSVRTLGTPRIKQCLRQDNYTAVISWDPVEGTDVMYRVYRMTDRSEGYVLAGHTARALFFDDGLNADEEPTYRITAYANGSGYKTLGLTSGTAEAVSTNTSSVFALMYHDFLTPENVADGMEFTEYALYASEFENDLKYLAENGYTTIDTHDLLAYLEGRASLPGKPVMLTIDDGSYGVYLNAFPLLKQYKMKAVLNVIGEQIDDATAYVGNRGVTALPFCTWSEIAEMSASGLVDIESHSYGLHHYSSGASMRKGASMDDEETPETYKAVFMLDKENIDAKIKEYTGREPIAFSYPYSARSKESDDVLRYDVGIKIIMGNQGDKMTYWNYFTDGKGYELQNTLISRTPRMTGALISKYFDRADSHDGSLIGVPIKNEVIGDVIEPEKPPVVDDAPAARVSPVE